MIVIDGSYGEGGGQVVRTSVALAAITGQPTRITSIRAGRRNPGLAPQHLAGVLALAQVCDADLSGARAGSTDLTFAPRSRPRPGAYTVDVAEVAGGGSAGAVSLIFQTLLLPLALAGGPSRLTLRGGTHVAWSPPFDYLAETFLPTVARMGLRAALTLDAWGFYPAGGGQVTAEIAPAAGPLAPLDLSGRGELRRVRGLAVACSLPADIAQRIANRAHNVLSSAGLPVAIAPRREKGVSPGAAIVLTAEYDGGRAGFSALGERGKPSDRVADEACEALLAHHADGAPVDPHLADQLLLPLALASGRSAVRTSEVTEHTRTNAHIIRQFVPAQIDIAEETGEIAVEGAT